jgi:DNA-binding XRE family transcriptional regulator
MDLKQWQLENRWMNKTMAKELGVTEGTICKIRLKVLKPSLLLAKAIHNFTDGAVTLSDLGISDNKVRVKKYRVKKL